MGEVTNVDQGGSLLESYQGILKRYMGMLDGKVKRRWVRDERGFEDRLDLIMKECQP